MDFGSKSTFSILILDVSGSMEIYYEELIDMANDIIDNQKKMKLELYFLLYRNC